MPPDPRKRARPGGDESIRRRKQTARKTSRPAPAAEPSSDEPIRLNRFLARAGIAARREADAVIAEGRVTVNGETVTEMGVKVGPRDRVAVDGRPVGMRGIAVFLLNKPGGVITTAEDERGRRTVMDLVKLPEAERAGLFPVGRLDRHTTGVLLLTTDGDLAHHLMHPRYEVEKLYVVTTARPLDDRELDALLAGVALEDGPARADDVQRLSPDGHVVGIGLHEGRNRQVRRMVEALGTTVEKLDRVGYAGLDLKGLRRGEMRRLTDAEVNTLRRRVKLKPVALAAPAPPPRTGPRPPGPPPETPPPTRPGAPWLRRGRPPRTN